MKTISVAKKFKQKDDTIKRIIMDYKKIRYVNPSAFIVSEKEETYLGKSAEYYTSLKEKVDYILLQMDKELSKVIYNEYLLSNNSNWWIYIYSKSTYYRMKNKAMNLFLEWWYA